MQVLTVPVVYYYVPECTSDELKLVLFRLKEIDVNFGKADQCGWVFPRCSPFGADTMSPRKLHSRG